MSLTPEEGTAVQAWISPDHDSLTAPQFRHLLTMFLREPMRRVAVPADALVRHPYFTHDRFLRIAIDLGTELQLRAFGQIGCAYLLAQRDGGADGRELWGRGYNMAMVAKRRHHVPSRAPRTDRIACTELVETCHDIGVGEVGCACWGEGEIAALLLARSQDLRELLAYL